MRMQRNPRSMRNQPLFAFRLTADQRDAAVALAARRGLAPNALAREALLAEVARDATRVNAPKQTGSIGGRAPHVEYDEG